jgi:hypothetical protein
VTWQTFFKPHTFDDPIRLGSGTVPIVSTHASMDSLPPKLLDTHTLGVELAGGLLHAVTSKREQEEAAEDACGDHMSKDFVLRRRTVSHKTKGNFLCEGTMFRHTVWDREERGDLHAPHTAYANPTQLKWRHQHLIESVMPYGREVSWETIWRKCESCCKADMDFEDHLRTLTRHESCKSKRRRLTGKQEDLSEK